MRESRPFTSPTARTTTPTTAAANPSSTPVSPKAAFTGPIRTETRRSDRSSLAPVRGGHPPGVGGDVVRRMLDQDLVREEGAARPVADGDHRDVVLEQLRRAAGVDHPDRIASRGQGEVHPPGGRLDRTRHHQALEVEGLAAEGGFLMEGL